IIFVDVYAADKLSQKVLDNYDRYKYYFSTDWNDTSMFQTIPDSLLQMKEITGFNKVGLISEMWGEPLIEGLNVVLPEKFGFEVVYKTYFPYETYEFSSIFAAAESAGVEVLIPLIGSEMGIPFVKEYYDRQSPLLIYGGFLEKISFPESWEWTDGKCEHICTLNSAVVGEYPLTNNTLSTRQAYFDKWNKNIDYSGALSYDILRFILPAAIEKIGTIETEAVIKALEEISIETSNARNWIFSSSHGSMRGENPNDPQADYAFTMQFQWQNEKMVPVYPKKIMDEAGVSLTFPDWSGPWDNID
ncbi:MAG: ABC transporter substrate-binding protein, partial [Candidatus Bathyarchaeota archaeon]